jgi:hypothetical protein
MEKGKIRGHIGHVITVGPMSLYIAADCDGLK